MITEQELKDKCTPEIIKSMVELAEGFEYDKDNFIIFGIAIYLWNDERLFPLLIHRAVEGWNKKYRDDNTFIFIGDNYVHHEYKAPRTKDDLYNFKNYQSQSLTQAECAELDCLLDIFKEEKESDE